MAKKITSKLQDAMSSCIRFKKLLHKDDCPYERDATDPPEDEFVKSPFVSGLDHEHFKPFLCQKDVALVMFYRTGVKQCRESRKHFKKYSLSVTSELRVLQPNYIKNHVNTIDDDDGDNNNNNNSSNSNDNMRNKTANGGRNLRVGRQAAETTRRENHAYAAVDCVKEDPMCREEGIRNFPYFRLYTRGNFVGFNDTPKYFHHQQMKKWVETIHAYSKMGQKIVDKKSLEASLHVK